MNQNTKRTTAKMTTFDAFLVGLRMRHIMENIRKAAETKVNHKGIGGSIFDPPFDVTMNPLALLRVSAPPR
jgi:hypothetical protein